MKEKLPKPRNGRVCTIINGPKAGQIWNVLFSNIRPYAPDLRKRNRDVIVSFLVPAANVGDFIFLEQLIGVRIFHDASPLCIGWFENTKSMGAHWAFLGVKRFQGLDRLLRLLKQRVIDRWEKRWEWDVTSFRGI